jgi:hypothetical protein
MYLTTHSSHKTETPVPLAGFKPAVPTIEELQTYTLDRAITGIGSLKQNAEIISAEDRCTPYHLQMKIQ